MIPFRPAPFSTFIPTFFIFADKSEIEFRSGTNWLESYSDLFRIPFLRRDIPYNKPVIGTSRICKEAQPAHESPSTLLSSFNQSQHNLIRVPLPSLPLLPSWAAVGDTPIPHTLARRSAARSHRATRVAPIPLAL
jgi:hypothetical protein